MFTYKNIQLQWLGHAWFLIHYKDKKICIDPFKVQEDVKAEYIFITHKHRDHLSEIDLQKIASLDTIIICPSSCEEALNEFPQKKIFLTSRDTLKLDGFAVQTIPAYNTDKFRSPGILYHAQDEWFVGFIFDFEWTRVYHAGDTDIIPEMKWMAPDIALLPIGGKYTMTPKEATEAAKLIAPQIVIPMHYGNGLSEDVDYLKAHAPCQVVLL